LKEYEITINSALKEKRIVIHLAPFFHLKYKCKISSEKVARSGIKAGNSMKLSYHSPFNSNKNDR
jgi:hypothetical protein